MSSSQDYFDFYHDTARSEKRYVVACVKTYDNTGTYISLKLFKKENGDNEFRFNQKLTLSMQELEQVGENIDAIRKYNALKICERAEQLWQKEVTAWFQFRNEWSKS